MSILKTATPETRARLALGIIAQQARALAEACQRVSESKESPADTDTVLDALQATLKHGGSRGGLLVTQEQETNLSPVLMMWFVPDNARVQARYQEYLDELEEAEQEGGQEAQEAV